MLFSIVNVLICFNELGQRRRHNKLVWVRRVASGLQGVNMCRSQLQVFLNEACTYQKTNIHKTLVVSSLFVTEDGHVLKEQ